MNARNVSTVTVRRTEYADFREKAREYFSIMQVCLADARWDGVLLNGVHAAICMADAITVYRTEQRSTSKSHRDAALLLSRAVGEEPEGRRHATRLAEILNFKHDTEYESERSSRATAGSAAKSVTRFMEWAERQLP